MRIKTTKKMRLDELIKYVWENDVEDTDFFSNEKLPSGQKVKLHVNPRDFDYGESGKKAGVSLKSHGFVVDDSYTFTVKVEEELTMDTKLDEVTEIYYDRMCNNIQTLVVQGMSIREILDENNIDIKTIAICRGEVILYSDRPGINRP